jgi:hypothetical protein
MVTIHLLSGNSLPNIPPSIGSCQAAAYTAAFDNTWPSMNGQSSPRPLGSSIADTRHWFGDGLREMPGERSRKGIWSGWFRTTVRHSAGLRRQDAGANIGEADGL